MATLENSTAKGRRGEEEKKRGGNTAETVDRSSPPAPFASSRLRGEISPLNGTGRYGQKRPADGLVSPKAEPTRRDGARVAAGVLGPEALGRGVAEAGCGRSEGGRPPFQGTKHE